MYLFCLVSTSPFPGSRRQITASNVRGRDSPLSRPPDLTHSARFLAQGIREPTAQADNRMPGSEPGKPWPPPPRCSTAPRTGGWGCKRELVLSGIQDRRGRALRPRQRKHDSAAAAGRGRNRLREQDPREPNGRTPSPSAPFPGPGPPSASPRLPQAQQGPCLTLPQVSGGRRPSRRPRLRQPPTPGQDPRKPASPSTAAKAAVGPIVVGIEVRHLPSLLREEPEWARKDPAILLPPPRRRGCPLRRLIANRMHARARARTPRCAQPGATGRCWPGALCGPRGVAACWPSARPHGARPIVRWRAGFSRSLLQPPPRPAPPRGGRGPFGGSLGALWRLLSGLAWDSLPCPLRFLLSLSFSYFRPCRDSRGLLCLAALRHPLLEQGISC